MKEKEIKLIGGEFLDEVVKSLLEEKENGNHVFCDFSGVTLHSDTVTLESAYLAVCGCSKEEFIKKKFSDDLENDTQVDIQESFEVNAENAVRDMRFAKLLYITKDNKFYSSIASEYIERMSKYAIYCKKEVAETWTRSIRELIDYVGKIKDDFILCELRSREYTGVIME